MKKMIIITALAVAISLPAAFGTGRFEVRTEPTRDQQRYDQHRDQQWAQAQANQRQQMENQRQQMEFQRQQQERERQQRDAWQRAQWQRDRDGRNNRHERTITYEFWLRGHQRDYDNRNRQHDNGNRRGN